LATLAQPWVFPTRETLEVYTNTRAVKAEHGIWRLMKGGKSVRELRDEDAYAAARTLNAIVTTQPSYTLTLDAADAVWHDAIWGLPARVRVEQGWCLAKYVEDAVEAAGIADQRLVLPASPELVAMTLDVIHAAAPSPSRSEPTVFGAVVLATMLDESAGTGEAIFEHLAHMWPVDVTTVRLTRQQREAVRRLLVETRGHRPATIERWPGRGEDYVWAYEWEGARYELAVDLAGSVAGLLDELLEVAPPAVRARVAEAVGVKPDGDLGRDVVHMARGVRHGARVLLGSDEDPGLGTGVQDTVSMVEAAFGNHPAAVGAIRLLAGLTR